MDKLPLTAISLAQDVEVSFATANVPTLHPTLIESQEALGGSPLDMQLTSVRRWDLAIEFEECRLCMSSDCKKPDLASQEDGTS